MACKDTGKKKKLVPVFLKSPVWLSFSMLMHTPNFTQNESSHWLSPLSFATGWLHSSSLTHWMSLCLARCSLLSSAQVSLQPAGDPLMNPDFREGYPVESFFPPAFMECRTRSEHNRSFIFLGLAGLKPFMTDVSSVYLWNILEMDHCLERLFP